MQQEDVYQYVKFHMLVALKVKIQSKIQVIYPKILKEESCVKNSHGYKVAV